MDRFDRWLGAWVGLVSRHAVLVLLLAAAGIWGGLHYTRANLGINTDTADMLSAELDYRKNYEEYQQQFPLFSDTLQVVLDAQTPDLARRAAKSLAPALDRTGLVEWTWLPQYDPFFEGHALLYLDGEELQDIADTLARVQPFLGTLTSDTSLYGLFTMLGKAADAIADGEDIQIGFLFEQLNASIAALLDGRFAPLSWQDLMRGKDGADPSQRRAVLIVRPKLDYNELLPAGPIIDAVRVTAARMQLDAAHGVAVRITGGLALSYEELDSAQHGAKVAGLLALVLVTVVLLLGLGSVRLVVASLLTLAAGLSWTATFAALAIGHLNLISVAFAVLYIGLGIDYAIHFGLCYRDLRGQGRDNEAALRGATAIVGRPLALCALTTGLGFLAFVPTDFTGVSELGLIGAGGMFISLFCSLTILPALLALMPVAAPGRPRTGVAGGAYLVPPVMQNYPRTVIAIATVVTALSALLLPHAWFDRNPLNLRDPASESVATFRDLLADSDTPPWPLALLVDDAGQLADLRRRLERLDSVDSTLALDDFVPEGQDSRLDVVEELGYIVGPLLPDGRPPVHAAKDHVDALARLLQQLQELPPGMPDEATRTGIDRFVRLARSLLQELHDPGTQPALLERLDRTLLASLPAQLELLRLGLDAEPFTQDGLPDSITQRWRAPDGRYRLEIYPAGDIEQIDELRRFVGEVRSVAPKVTASPVIMLESGNAAAGAFQQAFMLALAIITLLLLTLMQKKTDTLLVLAPLFMAGVLTTAAMVWFEMPFNFANVIALPLLLGIGVDNGIHMVNRYRYNRLAHGDLLHTSTTRAVVLSALTTICSFGNLSLASHPGMASMGLVLTLGVGLILACTLLLLPALLQVTDR